MDTFFTNNVTRTCIVYVCVCVSLCVWWWGGGGGGVGVEEILSQNIRRKVPLY